MAAVLPQDLAQAMMYGPQTQQAIRRSQYLSDALKQLGEDGAKQIQSPGELAAKLLAFAILNRGTDKAQIATLGALKYDQDAESQKLIAGLNPPSFPGAQPPAAPVLPPQPSPQVPATSPIGAPPQPQTPAISPQDRDALTRMLVTEAGGEGPGGMAAAAHVALNRLKTGYGGARSLSDVVYAPHQFEGIAHAGQVRPQDYAAAQQVADQVLAGGVPDPTGGATHFLNPELQQQLGRQIPAWAQGQGLRIGRHVFFGGQAQPGQAPQPSPAFQVAANGPLQPGMVPAPPPPPPPPNPNGPDFQPAPSAPVPPSPPAAGSPPGAPPPQAGAPGGSPGGSWPLWKPSQEEVTWVQGLLSDPRTHQAGVQAAMQMRQKMTQPEEATVQLINGVPFYVPKDPTAQAGVRPIPVPREAMSRIQTAAQAGVAAPPGTTLTVNPLGDAKVLTQPPNGQMVTSEPGQPYAEHYVPGGTNDPTRPQPAPQGYQYQAAPGGPMTQGPIPGGPADPKAPMNLAQGTQAVQNNLRPTIDLAVVAKQSMGAVQEGYKQQNGTGDIAMVNGIQHLIDKGVVRGEDVNMQMKSSGISGGLGAITQYINSNGLLTPEVRQRVLQAANALYGNIDQQYRAQVLGHRATVDAIYGPGAFDHYVVPIEQQRALGWANNGAPPAPTPMNAPHLTPGTRDAALAEARRRGLIPR